jgi:hypothetical protein
MREWVRRCRDMILFNTHPFFGAIYIPGQEPLVGAGLDLFFDVEARLPFENGEYFLIFFASPSTYSSIEKPTYVLRMINAAKYISILQNENSKSFLK